MKVKELPENQSLTGTKVKIPKHDAFLSGLNTDEAYIYSAWFAGIWVKTDLKSSHIYPVPMSTEDMLELEVIE